MYLSFHSTVALILLLVLGIITIALSIHTDRLKRQLTRENENNKRRMYELSILRAIQDRIGYTLDIQQIIDTVSSSLKNLFPYSTASSLVIDDGKLIFKVYIEEQVNTQFIDQVKKSMTASLATLMEKSLPEDMHESRSGLDSNESQTALVRSFFHIPLVVSGSVVGLINVSSTKPGLYKEADMTMLYQIVAQASNALTRLQTVIQTEEGKLLGMIRSLADGVFMIDNKDNLTLINERARTFLELSSDAQPSLSDILSKLPQKYDCGGKIQMAIQENKVCEEQEVILGKRSFQVTITPVVSAEAEKQVIGASVLMHDITLEKEMSHMKEEFTNAIVHELRSPLTAIKSASILMTTQKEKLGEEQQKTLLTVISKQTERMLDDIGSLLDAAKLESGHFNLFKKSTDIAHVLQESVTLFTPEANEKHIHLDLVLEKNMPQALCDAERIGQVVNNLLSNSLKFTPEEGTITLRAQKFLDERLPKTATNPGIFVSVTDTGIGIPKDKQTSLFSKFAQLDNYANMHAQGTGLGLYIAKGIVEAHGGNIILDSNPGKGTTVAFTLPINYVSGDPPTGGESRISI